MGMMIHHWWERIIHWVTKRSICWVQNMVWFEILVWGSKYHLRSRWTMPWLFSFLKMMFFFKLFRSDQNLNFNLFRWVPNGLHGFDDVRSHQMHCFIEWRHRKHQANLTDLNHFPCFWSNIPSVNAEQFQFKNWDKCKKCLLIHWQQCVYVCAWRQKEIDYGWNCDQHLVMKWMTVENRTIFKIERQFDRRASRCNPNIDGVWMGFVQFSRWIGQYECENWVECIRWNEMIPKWDRLIIHRIRGTRLKIELWPELADFDISHAQPLD